MERAGLRKRGGVDTPKQTMNLTITLTVNCDFNLLMPLSSLLISNKKITILQLIGKFQMHYLD